MRILIVGAGALGGYFGAHLLAAGKDVTFLVRPARAEQLAAMGLTVLSPNGDLHLPAPPTVLAPDLNPIYDAILLTPKSYDLASTIHDILPAGGPATLILPLLNGMAHLATLDRHFPPANVLGGLSNISATRLPDGTIRHLSKLDRFFFGPRGPHAPPPLEALTQSLLAANFNAELRSNILQDLWDKWVTIATAAGSTCLLRGTIGDIVAAGALPLLRAILDEASTIAAAEGYPTSPDMHQEILGKFTVPGSPFTASMLRDLESNAPIEREHIFGELLKLAREHDLPTPALDTVNAHLCTYEARRSRENVP